uniref:FXYD domain-containing ion transport regulator n=1 Tax=Takifugu rubripes TaxID=31033 RepID=A0A674MDH8_TAKRU
SRDAATLSRLLHLPILLIFTHRMWQKCFKTHRITDHDVPTEPSPRNQAHGTKPEEPGPRNQARGTKPEEPSPRNQKTTTGFKIMDLLLITLGLSALFPASTTSYTMTFGPHDCTRLLSVTFTEVDDI